MEKTAKKRFGPVSDLSKSLTALRAVFLASVPRRSKTRVTIRTWRSGSSAADFPPAAAVESEAAAWGVPSEAVTRRKDRIFWGSPSSVTSKSFAATFLTRWPFLSRTTRSSKTSCDVPRRVVGGAWAGAGFCWAEQRSAVAANAIIRIYFIYGHDRTSARV